MPGSCSNFFETKCILLITEVYCHIQLYFVYIYIYNTFHISNVEKQLHLFIASCFIQFLTIKPSASNISIAPWRSPAATPCGLTESFQGQWVVFLDSFTHCEIGKRTFWKYRNHNILQTTSGACAFNSCAAVEGFIAAISWWKELWSKKSCDLSWPVMTDDLPLNLQISALWSLHDLGTIALLPPGHCLKQKRQAKNPRMLSHW